MVADWLEHLTCNAESMGSSLARGSYSVATFSKFFTHNCCAPSMFCRMVVCISERCKDDNIKCSCIVLLCHPYPYKMHNHNMNSNRTQRKRGSKIKIT